MLATHGRRPVPGEPDLRGCRSSATPEIASGASTSFAATRSCSGVIGCSWSWTSARVAWLASACSVAPPRAPTSVACSTPPFMGRAHRSISAPIMTRCSRRTGGRRTYGILEIDEVKTVPHVPRSHPFVERLIGTIRREFLDQVLFWDACDLERKLAEFQTYYNEARGHASLKGYTPLTFAGGAGRFERYALGLSLEGPRPAPRRYLTRNSRRTGSLASSYGGTRRCRGCPPST